MGIVYNLVGIMTAIFVGVCSLWMFFDTFANKALKEAQAQLLREQAALVASQRNLVDAQAAITWAQAHMWEALSIVAVPATIIAGVIGCILLGVLAYVVVRTVPLWVQLLNLKIQKAQLALENPKVNAMPRPQRSFATPVDDSQVIIVDGRTRVPVEQTDEGLYRPISLPPGKRQLAAPTPPQLRDR